MSTIVTRLSSNGVYFTSNYFDEVTLSSNKVGLDAVYSSEFDEVTLQGVGGGLTKREGSDGKLYISGYFDEVTGIQN